MVNEFGDGIYSLAEGTYFGEIEILLDVFQLFINNLPRKRECVSVRQLTPQSS